MAPVPGPFGLESRMSLSGGNECPVDLDWKLCTFQ
jgi:hypothetical protein